MGKTYKDNKQYVPYQKSKTKKDNHYRPFRIQADGFNPKHYQHLLEEEEINDESAGNGMDPRSESGN